MGKPAKYKPHSTDSSTNTEQTNNPLAVIHLRPTLNGPPPTITFTRIHPPKWYPSVSNETMVCLTVSKHRFDFNLLPTISHHFCFNTLPPTSSSTLFHTDQLLSGRKRKLSFNSLWLSSSVPFIVRCDFFVTSHSSVRLLYRSLRSHDDDDDSDSRQMVLTHSWFCSSFEDLQQQLPPYLQEKWKSPNSNGASTAMWRRINPLWHGFSPCIALSRT